MKDQKPLFAIAFALGAIIPPESGESRLGRCMKIRLSAILLLALPLTVGAAHGQLPPAV